MAYRILAGGLDRSSRTLDALPVWDLGLQDREGSSSQALAARLPTEELDRWLAGPPEIGAPGDETTFALAWTLRGSPHLHRRRDLQRVADALWPADETDGLARLVGSGKALVKNGSTTLAGYAAVAGAMRRVVTGELRKPAASTALTKALPPEFSAFCAPCGSVHVMEMLFRVAALPGGIGLVPDKPATLQPLVPVIEQPAAQAGQTELVEAYLRLYGAGTPTEVAAHLGTGVTAQRAHWPETVDIEVEEVRLRTTPELREAIADADLDAAAAVTRLVPAGDPLLQPRERSLLTPDTDAWKVLWPAISPAGGVVAGGELVGHWKPRKKGTATNVAVTPWRPFTAAERAAVDEEARLIGRCRGTADVVVTWTS